jgi:hypothetical protein
MVEIIIAFTQVYLNINLDFLPMWPCKYNRSSNKQNNE